MKKIFYVLAGLTFCVTMTLNANALDLTQVGPGDAVRFGVTTGNPAFGDFNPSTNVIMDGVSQPTQFAVGGYHLQIYQKKTGKGFGMASDSSAMYYIDISAADASVPTITTSNSTAYTATDAGYEEM